LNICLKILVDFGIITLLNLYSPLGKID